MVHPLIAVRIFGIVAVLSAIVAVAAACGGEAGPSPDASPDPVTLLAETEANLRSASSAEFLVSHEAGSIFVRAFSAKITEVSGSWDANLGAEFEVDAYLVSSPDVDPESGVYIRMETVITPDGYYNSDPLSGAWIKQSPDHAPIPAASLNDILADVLVAVADPALSGEEAVGDSPAFKISGVVPSSAMNWLPITAEEGQTLNVEIWTDTAEKLLRRLRATGAVGQFDTPDTVRTITLTGINEPVAIEPPDNFVDLTGG